MIAFGNVPSGSVLPIPFSTYASATGASITLTGLAVTDVEVYKGTSVTQRSSDAGVALIDTDGIDIDGVTGIHGFSIDTGDNTDAGFYAVGSFFYVVVAAVTIDGQTVNFLAATFRLLAAEAIAGKTKADVDGWLGTAAATPTVAGVPEVDVTHWIGTAAATPTVAGVPEVDVTHEAGVAITAMISGTADSGSTTTLVDAARTEGDTDYWKGSLLRMTSGTLAGQSRVISAFNAATDTMTVEEAFTQAVSTHTYEIWPAQAAVFSNAAIKSDTAAILVDTGTTLDGRIPAALVSGRMDASVGAMAANVMTAAAAAEDLTTELQSGLATAAALDTVDNLLDTEIPAVTTSLATLTTNLATLQTSVDAVPTNAELATALGTADDAILSAISALNNLSTAQVGTEISTAALATAAALSTAQTAITAVKAKTDSLTFTTALHVDARMNYVSTIQLDPSSGVGGQGVGGV